MLAPDGGGTFSGLVVVTVGRLVEVMQVGRLHPRPRYEPTLSPPVPKPPLPGTPPYYHSEGTRAHRARQKGCTVLREDVITHSGGLSAT